MSAELDPDRVRAAGARWVFVPADAAEVRTGEYRLVHHAEVSMLHGSATTRPVSALLAEVVDHVRRAGRPRLEWWADERTVPADTEDQLAAAGLRMTERLEVLALPLRTELPLPGGVEVVEVQDREGLALAGRLQSEVFGIPSPSEAVLDDQLRSVTRPEAERLVRCYVAHVDGRPAGSAGSTVDGDALRFWEGSVLPAYRGRGVYRALVARRLRDARTTTAEFGLVKAVDDTSAPILRRLGFTAYGEQRCWTLPLA